MTDKQFVKSVHQNARLAKTLISRKVMFYIDIRYPNAFRSKPISTISVNGGGAWKSAAEYLRREMLKKLES